MKKTTSIIIAITMLVLLLPALLFLPACNSTLELLPDTMLVWALPYTWGEFPGAPLIDEWERAVVRAIRERGGNFGVRVIDIGDAYNISMWSDRINTQTGHNELIIEEINNGRQIDIASVISNPLSLTGSVDAYFQMYQAGLTLQLCDFLQSEEGIQLYEKFPPVVWDSMRINGEIHGFFINFDFGKVAGYSMDERVAEQIDMPLLTNNLADLIDLIPEDMDVSLGHGMTLSPQHAQFYNMVNIVSGITLEDNKVVSFMEHYLVNRYFEAIYNFDVFRTTNMSNPHISWGHIALNEILDPYTYSEIVAHVTTKPSVETSNTAIIINPQSDYTAEALQLITWLQTDNEFAHIFTFGEEGVHVRYEDGMAFNLLHPERYDHPDGILIEGFNMAISSSFGTCYITYPPFFFRGIGLNGVAQAHMELMMTLESAPHTGFRFDVRGWEEIILEINTIIYGYKLQPCNMFSDFDPSPIPYMLRTPFALGDDPDWEQTLANLNADLRAAGIGELIDEVQRQYDEWFALHSPVNR